MIGRFLGARTLLATTILASPPAAGAALQEPSAGSLTTQVRATLLAAKPLTIFDEVSAEVRGDEVVLRGVVTMARKRADVETQVAALAGVQRVRNEIRVLPMSRSDDELRQRVARAIYGHPSFWRYAAMTDPPIHILVENGRVTLTGMVGSDLERALARSLASGLGAVSVTSDLRTRAEIRSE